MYVIYAYIYIYMQPEPLPLAGDVVLERRGDGLRDLGKTGLLERVVSRRNPIVRRKVDTILLSLNSISRLMLSKRVRVASSALTLPSAPLSFSYFQKEHF